MKSNPFYDPYRVLFRVYSAGAHLKLALAETDLEPLRRAHTVKTVYGVLEHDRYLSLCISAFAPKSPKLAIRILLKIALHELIFLKKPRYTVTDVAVDLCKRMGKGGASGFVNAFLRAFDEEKVVLPRGDEGLSVRYNYPVFAVKKLKAQYGAERAEAIMAAKSGGVSVRFVRGEEKYLSRPHRNTPFEKLFLFENFTRDEGFFAGDYTFQSIGSVAICACVPPCQHLLDACAAPGGKSVLLSKTCGEVTACELHPHRARLIESYMARMGAENIRIETQDSTVFRPEWEQFFDGVLLDAPCSGFGTIAENPDLALFKTEEDLVGLSAVQQKLLETCARYLKAGGALTYSTCSVFQEENDGAVEAFLRTHEDFEAEEISSPLCHEKTKFGLQFLPDTAFGAGYFVARLRRKR